MLPDAMPLLAQSVGPVGYPNYDQKFLVQLPEGYKSAYKADGTCYAVGPKAVVAIRSMAKEKTPASARQALPAFTKWFFLASLHFRDLSILGMDDPSASPSAEADESPASTAIVLSASGVNSDGNEMAITATAFAWEHRFYVIFTVTKPADRDEIEAERQEIIRSVSHIHDD